MTIVTIMSFAIPSQAKDYFAKYCCLCDKKVSELTNGAYTLWTDIYGVERVFCSDCYYKYGGEAGFRNMFNKCRRCKCVVDQIINDEDEGWICTDCNVKLTHIRNHEKLCGFCATWVNEDLFVHLYDLGVVEESCRPCAERFVIMFGEEDHCYIVEDGNPWLTPDDDIENTPEPTDDPIANTPEPTDEPILNPPEPTDEPIETEPPQAPADPIVTPEPTEAPDEPVIEPTTAPITKARKSGIKKSDPRCSVMIDGEWTDYDWSVRPLGALPKTDISVNEKEEPKLIPEHITVEYSNN